MKKVRLKHKFLEKLSKKTGLSKSLLGQYVSGSIRPSAGRSYLLEDITGIPARVWVQGAPDQIRNLLNDALSE